MSTPRFGRVVTAMVTPFDDDLALDCDAAAALARWLVDHGSDGLVLAGTTGEGPTLSDGEKLDLFRAVRDAVTVPVIAGTGTNDTAHSVHLTQEAVRLGVDGVLVVTPYYNRPSPRGLAHHFRAVAEAAGTTAVVLYDIEVRSGRPISDDVLFELARDVPNIVAVKDASGKIPQAAFRCAQAPAGFELYSGNDGDTLAMLAGGGVGVISVASHWAGPHFQELCTTYLKGDVDGARAANARLLESYAFQSTDDAPNPVPAKAMARVLGHPVGRCRPPMGPDEPAGLEDRARQVLGNLG
ncbi:MAG TPA: 4-hydroxy-tetrahydrodipicolinate synthase [Acidimicrobiales bacterium]|nr:4-hydroxy-tetrahydrodipicolinate synthase [Acidimicrobiales bacterium]